MKRMNWYEDIKLSFTSTMYIEPQALVARNDVPPPPFLNFLFTYLFSIKFLYFFNISSRFPYFNLFVSIFIQSFVNSNLHVSTLYILIIHKARYSETFRIVHLLASVTFNTLYFHYIIQSRTCINS
jgi:hypothetical protein